MAQKLININKSLTDSQTWLKSNGGDRAWNNSENTYYHSIVFTNDGHILTHGIDINGSSTVTNLAGGETNSIPYQSANGKTEFLGAGSANQILTYTGSALAWKTATTYKLTLNGNETTTAFNSENDLGTFYAPTSAGTNGQILQFKGSAPVWVSLISELNTSNATSTNIPSAQAVKQAVDNAVTAGLTSYFSWVGNTEKIPTNSNKVGNAYRWNGTAGATLPAINSASGVAEALEIGDILICTQEYNEKDRVEAKFTVLQTNWSLSYDSKQVPTLGWDSTGKGEETTLMTLAGQDIKVKLANNPNTDVTRVKVNGTEISVNNTINEYLEIKNSNIANQFTVGGKEITITPSITGITENTIVLGGGDNANIKSSNITILNSYSTNTALDANTILTSNAVNTLIGSKGYLTSHAYRGISIQNSDTDKATTVFGETTSGILTLKAGDANISFSNSKGVVTITTKNDNTWRNVSAYIPDNIHKEVLTSTIGTADLDFGSEFIWTKSTGDDSDAIHLAWAEVDAEGKITYTV